jgi:hypothetical protein
MKLEPGERIVCAYAEPASGPGVSNKPLWVVVREVGGKLREECLQPEEQTTPILYLYGTAYEVHKAMLSAVHRIVMGKKG